MRHAVFLRLGEAFDKLRTKDARMRYAETCRARVIEGAAAGDSPSVPVSGEELRREAEAAHAAWARRRACASRR